MKFEKGLKKKEEEKKKISKTRPGAKALAKTYCIYYSDYRWVNQNRPD